MSLLVESEFFSVCWAFNQLSTSEPKSHLKYLMYNCLAVGCLRIRIDNKFFIVVESPTILFSKISFFWCFEKFIRIQKFSTTSWPVFAHYYYYLFWIFYNSFLLQEFFCVEIVCRHVFIAVWLSRKYFYFCFSYFSKHTTEMSKNCNAVSTLPLN